MGAPVLVVGSLNADMVVRTARIPGPGETVTGSDLVIVPGGKSSNQAAAIGKLGGDVSLLGFVGDDGNRQVRRPGRDEELGPLRIGEQGGRSRRGCLRRVAGAMGAGARQPDVEVAGLHDPGVQRHTADLNARPIVVAPCQRGSVQTRQ